MNWQKTLHKLLYWLVARDLSLIVEYSQLFLEGTLVICVLLKTISPAGYHLLISLSISRLRSVLIIS
ncbi:hypothetical protein [cyanobacterium endosymbiont of Rhopalodia gibberula]|uniref:hypothetical protein n=1 Tax=cyanobacterium endosymbiont of Rhopalodia gibberula TaxID=1763363 RepID=UPI0015586C7A|nr:hypothetical protein [cyanobacterium endosymbiont of Rhopalodia gibberula]